MPDAAPHPLPEGWFRALTDRAPDMIYRFRVVPPAAFEYVSPASEGVTGYAPEAYLADPTLFVSVIAPEAVVRDDGSVEFPVDAPPRHVHPVVRPDGRVTWVEVARTPVLDDGRIVAVEGAVLDTSIRTTTETRGGFEARIVGAIRDAVVVSGADLALTFWNAGAERILGISASEALGRNVEEVFTSAQVTDAAGLWEALRATVPWEGDLRLARPGEEPRSLRVISYPLVDEDAGPARVFIAWDVTVERTRGDVAARLATIVASADDAIYTLDVASRVLTWNRGAERLTGLAAAEVVGGPSPLMSPTPRERAAVRARVFAGETVRLDPAAFRHADGSGIPVSILVSPIHDSGGEVVALSVIARDERPRVEADRELRFRDTILNSVQDAVIATAPDFALLYWSPAAERLFGVAEADALGHRLEELVSYRLVGATEAQVLRQMTRGETFHGDMAFTRHDGTRFTGEIRTTLVPGTDGSQVSMAVIRDVTESRRDAEDSALLAAIVESAGDLVIASDLEGTIRSWNPGAERMLGYGATEMVGRTIAAFVATDHLPAAFQMRDRVVSGREASASGEYAYVAKDGSRIPVSVSIAAIRDASGAIVGVSSVAQNLSTRKALEDQLRQAQKLEAVGRLAGGVAHDFNNLLTAVTGYGSLLEAELPADSPALDDVRQILRATERASDLTRSLLAFSKGRPRDLRVVALDPLVNDLMPVIRRLIPERVQLFTSIASSAALRIEPTDLELVLVNLVSNAGEAMPDGGQLHIEARLVELDRAFAETHLGVVPGPHAQLIVADTGVGMTEDVRTHIFEPFFSTRSAAGSMGMGLATVHATVERAGGTIWVSTAPGEGTTFRILFPVAGVEPEPEPAREPDPSRSTGGSERVCLVEDDSLVRALATAVLRRGGYDLTVKADPREALAIDPADVDLLVADVVMPGLGGAQLARQLRERRPDLRVLFMSGFTERAVASELEGLSSQPLLQKPFSPASLLAAVRRALDA
jgi:PAS domain S-box-containing protein